MLCTKTCCNDGLLTMVAIVKTMARSCAHDRGGCGARGAHPVPLGGWRAPPGGPDFTAGDPEGRGALSGRCAGAPRGACPTAPALIVNLT